MSQLIADLASHPLRDAGVVILGLIALFILFRSFWTIGPTEVGLVRKRFGGAQKGDGPIAFHGEAGFQARLLTPGNLKRSFGLLKKKAAPGVKVTLVTH